MLRVISGGVGRDILKEQREKQKEEYPVDRSLLAINDWDAEYMFRNLVGNRKLSDRARKLVELAWARFRQRDMTTFMQKNQDSLSTWAVLDQGNQENNGNSFQDIKHFIWHFKYDLGPSMQGKLVEIIGPMRSGKNNFAVYLARAAMSSKIHVVTSFPMFFPGTQDGPLKDFYQEAHSHREAVLYMVRTRYRDPDAIFFLILDEQTTRGASRMRSNTLEAEWANGWIVRSGHFGCTTIRLMQTGDETIEMQRKLRYATIYKSPQNVEKAEGKFTSFGDDWSLSFHNVPDMSKYFNTASPGSWTWDLDPQAMNDYMAMHEGECGGDTMKIYRFYERYVEILKKTEEPYWFSNDRYRTMDRDLKELEEEEKQRSVSLQAEMEAEKRDPLPLHHENCPRVGNGLSWTWTPKKFVAEGKWVTCSKCKKGFKVHYSDGSSGKPGHEVSESGESPKLIAPDLMNEGYRGNGSQENSAQDPGGDTGGLNTPEEDLHEASGHDPPVDPNRGQDAASVLAPGKRSWSKPVPELEARSYQLRHEAAEKRECANCGAPLTGSQVYYCSGECKLEFYAAHPTSVRWNDLRSRALERDRNSCLKCGKPAEEVDHIREIWEGGPEFDLDNLQSLCHDCHVAKTNESRRRRDEQGKRQ